MSGGSPGFSSTAQRRGTPGAPHNRSGNRRPAPWCFPAQHQEQARNPLSFGLPLLLSGAGNSQGPSPDGEGKQRCYSGSRHPGESPCGRAQREKGRRGEGERREKLQNGVESLCPPCAAAPPKGHPQDFILSKNQDMRSAEEVPLILKAPLENPAPPGTKKPLENPPP